MNTNNRSRFDCRLEWFLNTASVDLDYSFTHEKYNGIWICICLQKNWEICLWRVGDWQPVQYEFEYILETKHYLNLLLECRKTWLGHKRRKWLDWVRVRSQRVRKFAEVTFITLNIYYPLNLNVVKTSKFQEISANFRKLPLPLIS